jgi:hypothetical protein
MNASARGEGEFILTLHLGFHNHKMCLKINRQWDSMVCCIGVFILADDYQIPYTVGSFISLS